MPLAPIVIPPGVYRSGTEYQAAGRWYDASLVRWMDSAMMPVGGWLERFDGSITAPRAALAWQDLSGDLRVAYASFDALKVANEAGTVTDITPAGLTDGTEDAEINTGYGGDFYGTGTYGTERTASGDYGEATTWALDTWGEYLVGCSNADGVLWEWQLDTGVDAAAITNAPTGNLSLVVTEERFIFALGAGGNPRKVQWCDREANTVWTPAATNEAGDIELQTVGQIMAGVRVRGQTLILTDTDAHAATYQGPPFVYGFQRVGSSCGMVARKAVAVVDEGAFWMGQRGFFVYRGSQVEPLECTVIDYVFDAMNTSQQSKTWAMANSQFGEVWWFYPSQEGLECDRYVLFNYREGHWAIGELERTCGFDRGVFRRPIMFDAAGQAWDHEIGTDHDGAETFAVTGPIQFGAGENVVTVTRLYPDERTQGDVTATFAARMYPNDTERDYGPFTMANPVSVLFTGRQFTMRLDAVDNADWRFGLPRVEYQIRGLR